MSAFIADFAPSDARQLHGLAEAARDRIRAELNVAQCTADLRTTERNNARLDQEIDEARFAIAHGGLRQAYDDSGELERILRQVTNAVAFSSQNIGAAGGAPPPPEPAPEP